MKRVIVCVGLVLAAFGTQAQAALFDFDGHLHYQNDVDSYPFTLSTDATLVEIWTDSFNNGARFDPITALWNADTGALIAQNDDNPHIRPAEQTYYDSGISMDTLAAGDYFFTIARYSNFAAGDNISDGFEDDDATPIPMSPEFGYYHLNFAGVDSVGGGGDVVVPLPGAALLGMLGLGAAGIKLRRHV